LAEELRASGEVMRDHLDAAREESEALRAAAEAARQATEVLRRAAEQLRVEHEALRIVAEQARRAAEEARTGSAASRRSAQEARAGIKQLEAENASVRRDLAAIHETAVEQRRVNAEMLSAARRMRASLNGNRPAVNAPHDHPTLRPMTHE